MCDTLAALPDATARGETLFAKNSDRERNEAQAVERLPAADHPPGARLALTYIAIDQVPRTHACLICRPFWMWGAEMGANEHGVVIGNEAVHATLPAARRRALTGMDLVRLGLERAASAAEAVTVITDLLERHGQGGDCGHLRRFYYNNSFLIADTREAFVLETVGRWWAVEPVRGVGAISNALSIGTGHTAISADLAGAAEVAGWRTGDGRFDFAGALADPERDAAGFGSGRRARSLGRLENRRGALRLADMMAALRDHGAEADALPAWTPADTQRRSVCMHASVGARRSQTTGSLVSQLRPGGAVHWVTASAAPCLSVFKPVMFETGPPPTGPAPTDRFDPATRWWRHERLHRAVLADYAAWAPTIAGERDSLERGFEQLIEAALAAQAGPDALQAAVDACWREADAAEARWARAVTDGGPPRRARDAHSRSWARLGAVAGLPRDA